jgi:hypothetical protein
MCALRDWQALFMLHTTLAIRYASEDRTGTGSIRAR